MFVAAPLFDYGGWIRRAPDDGEMARLEHERALAVQGLRELEFDHQMRKLSEEDWLALKASLEERALAAMTKIDKLSGSRSARGQARAASAKAQAAAAGILFCPRCGSKASPQARFCAQCGGPLGLREATRITR